MTDEETAAPEGYVWICPECGQIQKNLDAFKDVSCVVEATLVQEAAL